MIESSHFHIFGLEKPFLDSELERNLEKFFFSIIFHLTIKLAPLLPFFPGHI